MSFRVGDVFEVTFFHAAEMEMSHLTLLERRPMEHFLSRWSDGGEQVYSGSYIHVRIYDGAWKFLYNRFDREEIHELIGYDS